MSRQVRSDDTKARARRQRRAADTARWRSRRRRGVELFKLEAGADEYDLAIRFGGLKESQVNDRNAVSAALGRLLHLGLVALLDRNSRRR